MNLITPQCQPQVPEYSTQNLTECYPLSYAQKALWLIYQMAPESAAYNIYSTVRITSELNIEAWHRVWQKIVERHDILRSTYTNCNGEPIQVVHAHQEVDIKLTDESSWSESFLKKQILAEANRPFNLERGQLLRVNLFTRSIKQHIQLIAIHEIVGGMPSINILIEEFIFLYQIELNAST
jgi:hypothetical protein